MTLVSTHRRDFQCTDPQQTFVDGGSDYLRTGGRNLRMVEVLVNPEWPMGVSRGPPAAGRSAAWKLHCGFDPPTTATDDHVNHAIAWMSASIGLAHTVDDRALIDAGL
jgi:hypothetical protein